MATAFHKLQGAGGLGGDHWIALLGGANNDILDGAATDSLDNIVVVGYTESDGAGERDLLISKYDPSGVLLWAKILGGSFGEEGRGVTIDSSDNIIVGGYTASDGAGSTDFLLAKYNSSGTLLWDKTLGSSFSETANGVATDSLDNIVIVGSSAFSGGSSEFLIAKYNSSGTLLWNKALGGSGNEVAYGVAIDSSDNIIVTGFTFSDGAGGSDLLVAKYNSSGTLLWDKTLGGGSTDQGRSVAVDSSGNIVIGGYTNSDGAGLYDFLLAKYNSSGTLLWDKTLGGSDNEFSYGVAIDSLDNIVVVGYTESDGAGNPDCLVAKYDSSGTLLWDKTLGGSGGDFGAGVAIDSSDNIIVVGTTSSDGAGNIDCLVAKLPPDGTGDGTYGGLTYQDAVLTDAAAVLTGAAAVLTDSSPSLTDATAVLTDAVVVLTEEFFPI